MLRLAVRGALQTGSQLTPRCLATRSFQHIALDINEESKYAVLTMKRPPVNSLNTELLSELERGIKQAEHHPSCDGLILTSDVSGIFSAGLDIMEMYRPEQAQLRNFWYTLQEVWLTLFGSKLATIAAVSGASPAGGCLLAMSCDYRIMAQGKYAIGLNETQLGIIAPFWFKSTMERVVGQRETEKALMLGTLYPCDEALKIGLIDKLVPQEQLMDEAKAEMKRWLKVSDMARGQSKLMMRRAALEELRNNRDQDVHQFIEFCNLPEVQQGLAQYMEMLKKRQQGKK